MSLCSVTFSNAGHVVTRHALCKMVWPGDALLIKDYDPAWATQYQSIVAAISAVTHGLDLRFEHVGSTAVQGMCAKPIIDIDVVYRNKDGLRDLAERLSRIGYHHNGNQGIEGRDAFKRSNEGSQHDILDRIRHHLYACHEDARELARQVCFRDYLRECAQARVEYGTLKREIAAQAGQDHKRYAAIKEDAAREFIEQALRKRGGPS